METRICNDAIEYIMKTIDFLRKLKHIVEQTEESSEESGEQTNIHTGI